MASSVRLMLSSGQENFQILNLNFVSASPYHWQPSDCPVWDLHKSYSVIGHELWVLRTCTVRKFPTDMLQFFLLQVNIMPKRRTDDVDLPESRTDSGIELKSRSGRLVKPKVRPSST